MPTNFPQHDMMGGIPTLFFVVFFIIAFIVVGKILITVTHGVSEWTSNNQQPVLTEPVKVITKRNDTKVYTHHDSSHLSHHSQSTTYFVTFEFSAMERRELEVPEKQFGLVAEGDHGNLTWQGTRFLGFNLRNDPQWPVENTSDPSTQTAYEAREEIVTPPTDDAPPPRLSEVSKQFCPDCGQPVTAGYKFCPHCGKPQSRNPHAETAA